MAAKDIWGLDVRCLQGKTVCRLGNHTWPVTLEILMYILKNHMEVTIESILKMLMIQLWKNVLKM
eukprot:4799216-Ditylum_brightwellii.AAC.1